MSGRRFTWANALPNLKLDRILMSIEWELKFPLSPLIALSRDISDHTPLLIDTKNTSSGNN
jgi:endonuclease/exonuclease/phosphatase family metal-dependent hydrolase